MPSPHSALSLYRSILRSAQPMPYNFRMYARRRARDTFVANRTLSDTRQVQEAMQVGLEQLQLIRRQATMHGMFHSDPLVVEVSLSSSSFSRAVCTQSKLTY